MDIYPSILDIEIEATPLNGRGSALHLGSYNHKTDFLVSKLGTTTLLHEFVHFLDHISTPYGLFLDNITSITTYGYRRLLGFFNEDLAPPLPLPIKSALPDFMAFAKALRAASKPGYPIDSCVEFLSVLGVLWTGLVRLERSMEGQRLPSVSVIPPDYLVGIVQAFEWLDRDLSLQLPDQLDPVIRLELENTWSAPDKSLPKFQWGGKIELMGATSLLETRAFFIERALGPDRHEGDPLVAANDLGKIEYFAPFLATMHILMKAGVEDTRQMFDTYLVLADLALYTPIGRTYGPLRSSESWSEIHPGWRFWILTNEVDRIGPFQRYSKESVFEYQARFCEAVGWATPREFLGKGAELIPRNYRERRHRLACRKKLEWPEIFCLPSLLEEKDYDLEALDDFFSQVYCFCIDPESGDAFTSRDNDLDQSLDRLSTAYYQTLGWSYMVTGDPDLIDPLEPAFPYHKIVGWEGEGSLSSFFDEHVRKKVRTVSKLIAG